MVSNINESNDTILTAIATGLSFGNPGEFTTTSTIGDNFNILPGLDVDFFQVQLDIGDQLTIDIDTNEFDPARLDSLLQVFDASGNVLAFSDGDAAPGENVSFFDPFINFTASSSGTYYIGLSSFSNTNYNPFIEGSGFFGSTTGDYTVEIALTPTTELIGTPDDDFLLGTNGANFISGLEGDDTIVGLDSNDQLLGGDGDDVINAGAGDDIAQGGSDDDQISGDSGSDILSGDDGLDVIFGGEGFDQIFGGEGKDRLFGGFGLDVINGDDGNDTINGDDGDDQIFGGEGKDRIIGGFGFDFINGDNGSDLVDGGDGGDSINGGGGRDQITGNLGFDSIEGGDGADILTGGFDSDTLSGGEGDDRLTGVEPSAPEFGFGVGVFEIDSLTGGAGSDAFILGDAASVYYDDGNAATSGGSDYAVITDFDLNQDLIQLKGPANLYSLDFFKSDLGTIDAAIVYDSGDLARGELVGVVQGATPGLSLSASYFTFV